MKNKTTNYNKKFKVEIYETTQYICIDVLSIKLFSYIKKTQTYSNLF